MAGQRLKLWLAPLAWRLLADSWRCNDAPQPPGPGAPAVIFACLHRDMLAAIRYCRQARPTLLVSKSPDGDILIRTLAAAGFGFVRGSTGHGGREGFVGLLRVLQEGRHVGVAVDGPRGPFGTVHDGVLRLARHSGAPIVPLTVTGRGFAALGNWDRTRVPLPWARIEVRAGEPLVVPAAADLDTLADLRSVLARRLAIR
ncbi:MAG TPA: DUF374 domain-containing protein [Candidatus Krumholzibacteria bacterium]|nr:DUF374 domain-containing protein [Candidatus Krumholzibacteria bacterium]HPD71693.1 DUF374 domain-containing protein [Candidatus Krumholzibacteria bacterium]HRY41374.1 DUF374 domain-containing protein [Candidatus Krumholzibacteria bacterium]